MGGEKARGMASVFWKDFNQTGLVEQNRLKQLSIFFFFGTFSTSEVSALISASVLSEKSITN